MHGESSLYGVKKTKEENDFLAPASNVERSISGGVRDDERQGIIDPYRNTTGLGGRAVEIN